MIKRLVQLLKPKTNSHITVNVMMQKLWYHSCGLLRYFHLEKTASTSWKLLPRCMNLQQHAQNIINLLVFINLCCMSWEQPVCRLGSWSVLCFGDVRVCFLSRLVLGFMLQVELQYLVIRCSGYIKIWFAGVCFAERKLIHFIFSFCFFSHL